MNRIITHKMASVLVKRLGFPQAGSLSRAFFFSLSAQNFTPDSGGIDLSEGAYGSLLVRYKP
jgi:hypothetical protein